MGPGLLQLIPLAKATQGRHRPSARRSRWANIGGGVANHNTAVSRQSQLLGRKARDTIFYYNGTLPIENQTIPLNPGWNLVGYSSLTKHNITVGLNNLTFGLEADSIWTYNATIQSWINLGSSDYFEPGMGYWIYAKTECIWEVPLWYYTDYPNLIIHNLTLTEKVK